MLADDPHSKEFTTTKMAEPARHIRCGFIHSPQQICPADEAAQKSYDELYSPQAPDMVNHPPHYKAHPSGVECITVSEHFNFNMGNAIKYIWRADEKGDPVENLKKAAWYVQREIERREGRKGVSQPTPERDREITSVGLDSTRN